MPPAASGPVFTVSRPSLKGTGCATAGVGNRVNAAAVPAAVPARSVRRLNPRAIVSFSLRLSFLRAGASQSPAQDEHSWRASALRHVIAHELVKLLHRKQLLFDAKCRQFF